MDNSSRIIRRDEIDFLGMMGGEKHKGQVNRSLTDLHPYRISEIANGCFCIGLSGQGRREPEAGRGLALSLLRHHGSETYTPGFIRSARSFASFL